MKRSKRLDYTLVAEGHAEYAFIPAYLRLMESKFDLQLVRSKLGFKGEKAGKSKVLKEAGSIFSVAVEQGHQMLIVGVDLDKADYEREQIEHTKECEMLLGKLGKVYKIFGEQIVHFVTVQAIEQWLGYQSHRVSIGKSYSPHSLEAKTQSELKKLLYGEKDTGSIVERVAKKIAENADFDELAKQSRSFAHFHKQVTNFLEQYKTSST